MNKKLKILFLTRSFYPNIGGVAKHVLEISRILVKNGHSVTVITEQAQKSYSKSYHSNTYSAKDMGKTKNIRTIRLNMGQDDWFKKFRVWNQLFKNLYEIKSADIIHCHDVFFWYLPFRLLFPFKKVYTTFHGYEGNSLPTRKAILMHKISEKLSSGNICVGDFLKKWYGTKPDFVTYGAVDINIFKKSHKVKKNQKIIFIGRLEIETGIMEYLKALKILREKGKIFTLDVYGKGALENEVRKYSVENNLKLNLKGFINNIEAVIPYYEYVFCSRYLGILESLAFKKNIFAEYNNKIKKDYLEMSAFSRYISVSKNSNEIANSLDAYVQGKKVLDIDGGYNWVKDKTWDYMTTLYLKLWKFS